MAVDSSNEPKISGNLPAALTQSDHQEYLQFHLKASQTWAHLVPDQLWYYPHNGPYTK